MKIILVAAKNPKDYKEYIHAFIKENPSVLLKAYTTTERWCKFGDITIVHIPQGADLIGRDYNNTEIKIVGDWRLFDIGFKREILYAVNLIRHKKGGKTKEEKSWIKEIIARYENGEFEKEEK